MIIAFNKPYGILSQFSQKEPEHRTLSEFGFPKGVYPIGRLDKDSEGLLLLSDEKKWNNILLNPKNAHERTYHVQVEGIAVKDSVAKLEKGIILKGIKTKSCRAKLIENPGYPERVPPIRFRLKIPTSWIELILTEGKNRQVRHMTSAVGLPALRLIRVAIGSFKLAGIPEGKWRELSNDDKKLLTLRDKPHKNLYYQHL